MNTTERIFDLLNKRNITAKALSLATGISTGNISDWKSGKANPSYGAIVKIAKYLNVSEKYLQCETNDPTSEKNDDIPPEFAILARKIGDLPEAQKKRIYQMLDSTVDNVLEMLDKEE